jgi:hypothetical protein
MMLRTFRLTNEPGGLGLSCSPDGLALAGVPLLAKTAAGFEPRPAPEIAALIKAAYGANGDLVRLQSRLEAIARALNNKDFGLAAIAAVQMQMPELNSESAARVAREGELSKYNYNPNEPRDWHGRWTSDGSSVPVNITTLGTEGDQRGGPHVFDRPQRVADIASDDATASSNDAGGESDRDRSSSEEIFARKYDDLGPVDFAKEIIQFGYWLERNGHKLSPAEREDALAEYRFLHDRLSSRLGQDYESEMVQGNLQSAGLILYQGAVNAGLVTPGRVPDRTIVAVLSSPLAAGDGPPGRPYRTPRLKGAPAAASQVPKDLETPGSVGGAEKPIQITLGGVEHTMPDWHMEEISYTKRPNAEREALRAKFDDSVREAFVKDLAENHAAELRDAGISDADIVMMTQGNVPEGYQVHHKLPLDDGGTNATTNLVLMKYDPDHKLLTSYQKQHTGGMLAGETLKLEWPMPDSSVRIWPKTPRGGAYPDVHKLEWSTSASQLRVWPKVPDRGAYFQSVLSRRSSLSDIDDILAAIDAYKRGFGDMLRPPASPEGIERLRKFARDRLRADLSESYVTFLGKNDGFIFNTFEIYATTQQPFLSGFVEANEAYAGMDDGYVYYGEERGQQIYAHDRMSGMWVVLEIPSLHVNDTFPSFDALLAQVLRASIKGVTGF